MFVATIGEPTGVKHLRVLVNPVAIERSARRCGPDELIVYINTRFDPVVHTALAKHAASGKSTDPLAWVDDMAAELARRTCSGTISKGTNQYINFYPTPGVLAAANERLAAQGIRMEINPYANDDGQINVWIEYTRQPAFHG
ncbi:hypothetical protein KF707_16785 [Candidatus Obscuribacterales bacterium]|nr:hypothetical protein [Candidatus Obscuribacterales bacterium]